MNINAEELLGWLGDRILFVENERKYHAAAKDSLISRRIHIYEGGSDADELEHNNEDLRKAYEQIEQDTVEIRAFGSMKLKVEQMTGQSGEEKKRGE